MERTGSYRKVEAKATIERNLGFKIFLSNINFRLGIGLLLGFFISRVTVLYMMNSASIAYLTLFSFSGTSYYGILISVVLGLISVKSQTDLLKYLLTFGIITAIHFFVGEKKDKLVLQVVTGTMATFTAGIVKALALGMSLYFVLMAVLETILVFAFVFLFYKAVMKIIQPSEEKYFTNDALISIAILLGGAIIGMGSMSLGNINIMYVLVFIIILVIGYRGGAVSGAAAGLILGLFMMITNNFTPEEVVIASSAGLICGFVHEIGKIPTSIAFVTDIILVSMYLDKSASNNKLYLAAVVAFIVFNIVPKKVYERIKTVVNFDERVEDRSYVLKVQEVAVENLNGFSKAFRKLGDTFSNLSQKRTNLSQKEITRLFDDVASKVCIDCGMSTYCWESYFYNTYQTMFSILAAAEKKGHIDKEDIPLDFRNKCVKLGEFVDTTNRMFEIYKNNLMWNNRIIESRKLISEQLESVAIVINNLSNDMKLELNFKEDLEKAIKFELSHLGALKVTVIENKYKKYEVTITNNACYGRKVCIKEIIPKVNAVLNRKMKAKDSGCMVSKEDNMCTIKLVEEQKYKVIYGVSRAIKSNSKVSGDNYTFMEIKNGQCLMALSDGMGSGNIANRESSASIELLEEFLEAGFDKDVAIKMINSVLVLKSTEESFSTIDMCIIDLHDAVAEFVKIGAASTYIKRGTEIGIIKSTSLPVGILSTVDMEVTKKRLKDGDIIIMITDGIIDSSSKIIAKKDNWIEQVLREMKTNNPQDIADYILQAAKDNSEGNVQDDMTVLVAKFWGKA